MQDWHLDFEEFRRLTNDRIGASTGTEISKEKLRAWYLALDSNGDGVIDPTEFFLFALREAILRAEHGTEHAEDLFASASTGAQKDKKAFAMMFSSNVAGDAERHQRVSRVQFLKLAQRLGFTEEIGATIFDDAWLNHLRHEGKRPPTSGQVPTAASLEAAVLLRTIQGSTQHLKPMISEWMRADMSHPPSIGKGKGKGAPPPSSHEHVHKRLGEDDLLEVAELNRKGDVHGLVTSQGLFEPWPQPLLGAFLTWKKICPSSRAGFIPIAAQDALRAPRRPEDGRADLPRVGQER